MKKVLLFSTALLSASAQKHGRELGVWGENGNDSTDDALVGQGGTMGDGNDSSNKRCVFRSTDDIFDHEWPIRMWSQHLNGTLVETGGEDSAVVNSATGQFETNEYTAPYAAWQTDPLVIAEFDIDLKFKNYHDLVHNADTKNYIFYDHDDDNGWRLAEGTSKTSDDADNGIDATGLERMTRVCVYKNSPTACTGYGVDSSLIAYEVSDANNCDHSTEAESGTADGGECDGERGPILNVKIGVRKVVGVATTCGIHGNGNGGDIPDGVLSSLSKDIFVWSSMTATADLKFQLISNIHGPHDLTGEDDALRSGDVGNPNDEDVFVTYSLKASAPEPETHDLLFIEAPKIYNNQVLFSDHPDADADGITEYRVDMTDADYEESRGKVTASVINPDMKCGVELTVNSGRTGHWHCFRNEAAQVAPHSSDLVSTEYGNPVDSTANHAEDTEAANVLNPAHLGINNEQTEAIPDIGNNGVCRATLTVTCDDARAKATLTDDRECDIPDYGPDEEAKAERLADFKTCIESTWYTETYYYFTNEVVLDGEYDTAIVQAVRLNQKRRYPMATSGYVDLSDATTGFDSETNAWQCRDGTTCADSDPYQVLDAHTVTAKQTMGGLVAATKDYDSAVYNGYDAVVTATTGSGDKHAFATRDPAKTTGENTIHEGNDKVAADHLSVGAWTCTGHTSGCANLGGDDATDAQRGAAGQGPSYQKTVDLKNPPMGYPEAYLFAAVSFDFKHDANANGEGNAGANTGDTSTGYATNDQAATTIVGANTDKTDIFHTNDNQQADHDKATTSGATNARRLGAKRNLKSTVRTLMVNAVQNVIQK